MKTPREAKKCREWEKVRRDKLNTSFTVLSKLLPNYDPSVTFSKIDILQKATSYIEELKKKLKDMLVNRMENVQNEEMKGLDDCNKKLLVRIEQLTNLLRDAGIKVPTEYGNVKQFKEPLRWSNKITAEQAKEFAKKEAQKENKKTRSKSKKDKPKKNVNSSAVKNFRKNHSKKFIKDRKTVAMSSTSIRSNFTKGQSCFIIANSSTCINLPQNSYTTTTAPVKTSTNTIITTNIKPINSSISKINTPFSSLGPGTLILANGSIVPVLPQSATVLPAAPILSNPIVLKPPKKSTTLFIVPSLKETNAPSKLDSSHNVSSSVPFVASVSTNCSNTFTSSSDAVVLSAKTYPRIRPKLEVTKTTQANKVPIPALISYLPDSNKPDASKVGKCRTRKTASNGKRESLVNKTDNVANQRKNKKAKRDFKENPVSAKRRRMENESKKDEQAGGVGKKQQNDVLVQRIESGKPADDESLSKKVVGGEDKMKSKKDDSLEVVCQNGSEISGDDVVRDAAVSQISEKGPEGSFNKNKREDTPIKISIPPNLSMKTAAIATVVATTTAIVTTAVTSTSSSASVVATTVAPVVVTAAITTATTMTSTTTITAVATPIITTATTTGAAATTSLAAATTTTAAAAVTCQCPVKTNDLTEKLSHHEVTEIQEKNLDLGINLNHSELSNDIFSSLQVPMGNQNPESTSPTAAFLLAFPLVSSLTGVKVTEVIEEENSDSRHGTPTLLQIGTMDTTKTTHTANGGGETLTPNLLNLDSFSFFSVKDACANFYSSYDNSGGIYSFTSTTQSADAVKTTNYNTKASSSKQLQPQLQNKDEELTKCLSTSNPVVSNPSTVAYSSIKPDVLLHGNFSTRQNTSVTYSKSYSVPATYTDRDENVNKNSIANVHCDSRQKIPSDAVNSACKDMAMPFNYTGSSSIINRKNLDNRYNTNSTVQCNTFNPFSDLSKPTIDTHETCSKPFVDPVHTGSINYSYATNNTNNFDQSTYYTPPKSVPSKTNSFTYNSVNYGGDYDGRKRDSSTNQRYSSNYYGGQQKMQPREKFAPKHAKSGAQPKPPINWMTSPDFRSPQTSNAEYLMPPPFAKDIDYTSNTFYSSNSFVSATHTYFNTTTSVYAAPEFQNIKSFNSSLPIISASTNQKSDYEENQFSWSPTKLPQFLETPHTFVSSTLPTLVGDLALGTTQSSYSGGNEQKLIEQGNGKMKETLRRSKAQNVNYDNVQSNFLSVSQLVESKDSVPARVPNRRNSNRNSGKNAQKASSKHSQKSEAKEIVEPINVEANLAKLDGGVEKADLKQIGHYNLENTNWNVEYNRSGRHGQKSSQSSYSAEALIGHPNHSDHPTFKQKHKQQQHHQPNYAPSNKTLPIPTFLSDNIVPSYFPSVEIPQDNNFGQSNQNYHSSFCGCVQNGTYTSNSYITTGAAISSGYLQSPAIVPEFNAHDYGSITGENVSIPGGATSEKIGADTKQCSRNESSKHTNNRTESQQLNMPCSINPTVNCSKKMKHKNTNDGNLPGIDFGFITIPTSINSPILPDDFHSHSNFLPPPTPGQLYPCKNPLYTKQGSDVNSGSLLSLPPVPVSRGNNQSYESVASSAGNIGPSLTSFNLSAIFPEMNKGTSVPLPGIYSEPSKNKTFPVSKHYISDTTQISSSNKISSNYANTISTSFTSSH